VLLASGEPARRNPNFIEADRPLCGLAKQGSAKALLAQLLTEQQRTNQLLEWLGQVIQQGQQHP